MNSPAASNSSIAGQSSGDDGAFDFTPFAAEYGGTTIAKAKAGTVIYAQGDATDSLFYIRAGQVRVQVVSPEGKTIIMATLGRDAVFGETCLLDEKTRVATITCLSDCLLVRVARTTAIRALRSNPRFAEFLLARILRRVHRLRALVVSHLFDTSEQRLARLLLMLANYGRGSRNGTVIGKLDQQDLAHMVGTTRPRVSYFMNKFRKQGYIDYNDHIVVHRSLANVLSDDTVPGFGIPEDSSAANEDL